MIVPSIGSLSGHLNLSEHWTTDSKSHCPVTLLNCNCDSQINCDGTPAIQRMNDRQLRSMLCVEIVWLFGHWKHWTFSGQSQARVNGLKWNSGGQFPGSGPPSPHRYQALQFLTFGMNAFNSSSSQIEAFWAVDSVTRNAIEITYMNLSVRSKWKEKLISLIFLSLYLGVYQSF